MSLIAWVATRLGIPVVSGVIRDSVGLFIDATLAACHQDSALLMRRPLQDAKQSIESQGRLGEEKLKGLIVLSLYRLTAC